MPFDAPKFSTATPKKSFKMNKKTVLLATLLLSLVGSISASAAPVIAKTDTEGLVIKKFQCRGSYYVGNIINRSDRHIFNVLIKSFNTDGNLVGSCRTFVGLSPDTGDGFTALGCNCKDSVSYEIQAH